MIARTKVPIAAAAAAAAAASGRENQRKMNRSSLYVVSVDT
jgi:hypothetical protein